jgi:hypothetical protein
MTDSVARITLIPAIRTRRNLPGLRIITQSARKIQSSPPLGQDHVIINKTPARA